MSAELATWYPVVRLTHVSLVLISGALFGLRGLAVLSGHAWAMRRAVRRLSYGIDTGLLSAALLLLLILHLNPFATPWLLTKIVLLFLYIALGTMALKRARTPQLRRYCFVAALLCFGFMLSVALTHSPLGALRWFGL